MNNDLRNPWHDIDAWKEFKHDMRHPVKFVRGAIANVNNVSPVQRRVGAGIAGVGLANALLGIAMIARGIV